MRAGGGPRQLGPQQRRMGEIERPAGLGGDEPPALRLGERAGQARQVDDRHQQRTGWHDGRDRYALPLLDPRPQDLVASRHLAQPCGEGADVERLSVEPERHQDVGVRAFRVHPLRQPHPSLTGREEDGCGPGAPGNAGPGGRGGRGFPFLQSLGEERPLGPREFLQTLQAIGLVQVVISLFGGQLRGPPKGRCGRRGPPGQGRRAGARGARAKEKSSF